MAELVRTLLVDDDAHFLDVAGDVVRANPAFACVGEATTANEALAFAAGTEFDLAIVDVQMPEMDGIELTRRLKVRHPRAVVALITADEVEDLPVRAHYCGASFVGCKQGFGPAMLREMWAAPSER